VTTSTCVSRYGIQGMVGDVLNWNSDQTSCDGSICTGITSAVVPTNSDFNGLLFDDLEFSLSSDFLTQGKILLPLALPVPAASISPPETTMTWGASSVKFHGDYYFNWSNAGFRGALSGGLWDYGAYAIPKEADMPSTRQAIPAQMEPLEIVRF